MRIFATSHPTDNASHENLNEGMDEEIAKGREFYREGLIVEAYMDPGYRRAFMILEAASVEAARTRFNEYPQVRAGLIAFEFTPLIGLPAVAQVHEADASALPGWWPEADVT